MTFSGSSIQRLDELMTYNTPSETLAQLKALRALLADESNWCKGAMARTPEGYGTSCSAKDARSFCLLGAARKVTNWHSDGVRIAMAQPLRDRGYSGLDLVEFNDVEVRKHHEVLAVIDEAIERTQCQITS